MVAYWVTLFMSQGRTITSHLNRNQGRKILTRFYRLSCCSRAMYFLQRVLRRLRWDSAYIWLLWKQGSFSNGLWGTGYSRSHRRVKASVIIFCTAVTCFIFTIANMHNSGMSDRDNLSSSHDNVGPCLGHKIGLRGWVNSRVVSICQGCQTHFHGGHISNYSYIYTIQKLHWALRRQLPGWCGPWWK